MIKKFDLIDPIFDKFYCCCLWLFVGRARDESRTWKYVKHSSRVRLFGYNQSNWTLGLYRQQRYKKTKQHKSGGEQQEKIELKNVRQLIR